MIECPLLTGVHHVSVPTSDPLAGSDWYVRVFGFATLLIEERESDVVAVPLQHPCGARLLLRHAAAPLAALRGYPLFGLAVASHTELLRWVEHLTTVDVEHSAVHQAHLGWAVTVTGPDLSPYPAPHGRGTQRRRRVDARIPHSRHGSARERMARPLRRVVVAGDLLPRYAHSPSGLLPVRVTFGPGTVRAAVGG